MTYVLLLSDSGPTNIPPLSSPLQYTTSNDIITPIPQNTYSSNLDITYNHFQGCISRDVLYPPKNLKPSESYPSRRMYFKLNFLRLLLHPM